MTDSKNDSNEPEATGGLREFPSRYELDLPIDPAMPADPPKGTWEDGYRLSLLAFEAVRNRPEIFAQRDARMCFAEFRM